MPHHTRILAALFVASLSLSAGVGHAADQTMKLTVEGGDSVGEVLSRHAGALRGFFAEEGPWRHLSAAQLARRLLRRNMRRLPHGIYAGNVVIISRDGDSMTPSSPSR